MGENGINVAIVMYQFSVVVKSMEKGLLDKGFKVQLVEDDISAINATLDCTDAYIVYLQDSILGDAEKIKVLLLICDMMSDRKRRLIFIGSDNSKELFFKTVPALQNHEWLTRPVDLQVLAKEIKKETDRMNADKERRKILIIDDDPLYASMIGEWLKDNFHMEMVSDGMQGISWLAKNSVDLILLDYEMPVVDGPKILEMLRSHPDTSSIPVMFLTGIGTKESIARVMGLKPQGYILKSTTRKDLIKTLEDFFEKHGYGLE
ncbi:MAG: response regulator [Lachnospiraceae bacterium]|nr:response regulator [Lachnospiraceae bacterium]